MSVAHADDITPEPALEPPVVAPVVAPGPTTHAVGADGADGAVGRTDPDLVPVVEPAEHEHEHEHEQQKKPKKPKKKKHGKLAFAGRAFVRGAVVKDKADPDAVAQGTVNSARVKVEYRWHALRAELAAELATRVRLKTAFIQLRLADGASTVDVRAGQMKMPFSAIQLTSIWGLPMADRGLLDNVLVKRLQVAGRAVGAMVIAEWPSVWSATLQVGVFQGTDDAGTALAATASNRFGQDGVARLSVRPAHGLELGVAGSARVGEILAVPLVVSRGYAGEVDATLDVAAGPGVLRVWAEGMLGTSWLVSRFDPTRTRVTFAEGRGIASYRLGGAAHGKRYGELYGVFGALDPDTSIRHDLISEATGGVTYGAWNAWRIQLELERWQVASAAPIGIVALGVGPATSTTFLVQLGARL